MYFTTGARKGKFIEYGGNGMPDKFRALAEESMVAVAILGNERNGDFELLNVDFLPLPADTALRYKARGLGFLGIIGIVNGQPLRVVVVDSLSDELHISIRREFQRLYGAEITRVAREATMGDSALWLENLHRLPDPRA